ncbi:MAG: cytochrome P450 [Gemmatimonadales bacterium]
MIDDDLLAPDVIADPYAYYGRIREIDPVHFNRRWGGWLVTRYDDVQAAFRDHRRFSSDRMASLSAELPAADRDRLALLIRYLAKWFVFADPPYHTRARMLVNKAFTPTSAERLRERTRAIVRQMLAEQRARGEMEFVRDFAQHLPVIVISEYLGVPVEDREQIRAWSEEISGIFFIKAGDADRRDRSQMGLEELVRYFEPLVRERRAHPKDDLITALIQAEERGDLLSEEEVLATCTLLIFAGHESTTFTLVNGLLALLRHPEQWEWLRADPSLIRTAADEVLRYDGTVKATFRSIAEPVEMGGKTLSPGERALLVLASANRDPARFPEPDRFDITRSPNPHLAFGSGIHICLGAPLARLELQETYLALASELPGLELATERVEYQPTIVNRAVTALPIRWRS